MAAAAAKVSRASGIFGRLPKVIRIDRPSLLPYPCPMVNRKDGKIYKNMSELNELKF